SGRRRRARSAIHSSLPHRIHSQPMTSAVAREPTNRASTIAGSPGKATAVDTSTIGLTAGAASRKASAADGATPWPISRRATGTEAHPQPASTIPEAPATPTAADSLRGSTARSTLAGTNAAIAPLSNTPSTRNGRACTPIATKTVDAVRSAGTSNASRSQFWPTIARTSSAHSTCIEVTRHRPPARRGLSTTVSRTVSVARAPHPRPAPAGHRAGCSGRDDLGAHLGGGGHDEHQQGAQRCGVESLRREGVPQRHVHARLVVHDAERAEQALPRTLGHDGGQRRVVGQVPGHDAGQAQHQQPVGQTHRLHDARHVGVFERERAVVVDLHVEVGLERVLRGGQQLGRVGGLGGHAVSFPVSSVAAVPSSPLWSTAPPNRRSRLAYSRHASHSWVRSKSGNRVSWKTNSAYADSHSRKFDVRSSPEGRRNRSTSGISGWYRYFAMVRSSTLSGLISPAAAACAMRRAASPISARPP